MAAPMGRGRSCRGALGRRLTGAPRQSGGRRGHRICLSPLSLPHQNCRNAATAQQKKMGPTSALRRCGVAGKVGGRAEKPARRLPPVPQSVRKGAKRGAWLQFFQRLIEHSMFTGCGLISFGHAHHAVKETQPSFWKGIRQVPFLILLPMPLPPQSNQVIVSFH